MHLAPRACLQISVKWLASNLSYKVRYFLLCKLQFKAICLQPVIWPVRVGSGDGPGRPWVLMGLVFYRCAATILVATVATLRRKWRSFHKVLVNHHLNDLNCNTSRVNQEVIFPLCYWRGVIPLLDDLLIPLTLLTDSLLFSLFLIACFPACFKSQNH